MTPWPDLRKPSRLSDRTAGAWFAGIADALLNRTRWVIAGHAHRMTECEFYFRGPPHDDPFTHGDPIQVHAGRWYFHKTAGNYRGGSFKGVDVTFGDGVGKGGILIRGAESADGRLIDGPSLIVDHLLASCGHRTVERFDRELGARFVWDPTAPMYLARDPDAAKAIVSSARVGLSLRRAGPGSTKTDYLTRQYRFLTEPRRIAKGKPHMVMALHRAGRPAAEIREVTGVPARSIATYIVEYEAGVVAGRFEDYFGKEIGPKDMCRLHGIADREFGQSRTALPARPSPYPP
ncbi:MAG TPA: hypothetical protein VKD90_17490 [Gemmataceae bacterium]|nr:hypothetical protein [Gemmataceae bacterium]